MKVIITKRGLYRNTHPRTAGQFQLSEKHDAYLYQGREFSAEEFNKLSDSKEWIRLIERDGSAIMVKVVEEIEAPKEEKRAKAPKAPKVEKPTEVEQTTKYPVFAGPKNGRKPFSRTA